MTAPARRLAVAFAALIAAAVVVWLLMRGDPPKPSAEPPQEPEETQPHAEAPAPGARLQPPPPRARQPAPLEYADDGIPIMPADPNDPRPDGPVHPHPITPRHQRIYRENHLVGQLNGAMDVKDVAGMRKLLEEYRRDYPEDEHSLQAGYEIVANCFERPGEATRAAALQWAETHRGSTLRRFVNRHCVEPPEGQ